MATKKYLSLDRLTEYDALIKAEIDKGDESALETAKSYTDTQIANIPSVDAYTKAEMDAALEGKSDSTHNHDSDYDAKGSAETALEAAKSYTDTKTANLISTSDVETKISTHDTSTSAHNDIRALISDLSTAVNNFLDVDDTTTDQLSEVLTLINNNKGTLESLTTSKVNVADIVDNLTTNNSSKVLSAAQGVVIKGLIDALDIELDTKAASEHTHTITDVTNLQNTLDDKSDIGHTHTVDNITDLTVTAVELNYVSGVASSVQTQLDGKVPATRTINGKALSTDITLSASDVNAYSKTEIDNLELITVADIDAICGVTS